MKMIVFPGYCFGLVATLGKATTVTTYSRFSFLISYTEYDITDPYTELIYVCNTR